VQTGFKNNKPMVACKDIWVRKGNQPVFSYHYCDFLTLNLVIPDLPVNDFDSYVFSVPTSGITVNINKSNLPFSNNYTIPPVFNAMFRITGVYDDVSKNCSTNLVDVNIPNLNFGQGTSLPHYPNINFIELTNGNNARIGYSGPFAFSANPNEQYNLYMFPKNNPATFVSPIKSNLNTGVFNVSIPDSTKSYCFIVQKNKDHCNNSSPERSGILCTQPMLSLDFTPIKNTITIDQYPFNFLNTISTSVIFSPFQKVLVRTTKDSLSRKFVMSNAQNTIIDNTINCKKKNCYRVEVNSQGRFTSILPPVRFLGKSVSNQMCFDASKQKPDPLADVWVSTEKYKNIIRFSNTTTWNIPVNKVFLQKAVNLNYKILDSVNVSIGKMTDVDSVMKSEIYKIFYRDNCDAISLASDSVQNIFLQNRNGNELIWNSESPYSILQTDRYKIYYLDESLLFPIDSVEQASTFKTFVADLTNYTFKGKFKVASISNGSSARYSFSNILEIPIKQNFILPQVFSPNHDGNNDLLEVFKYNPNAQNIIVEIFNRYGGKIFEINKNNKDWDGTVNGKSLPKGSYVFKAKAVFPNNEIINVQGIIQIIK
jgi:gliding motility-associated-like protein